MKGGAASRAAWAVVCSLWTGAALAAPSPGTAQDEAAQTAFRAGVEAARQERWADARSQFEKAFSLSPRPVVLINLAGAQARTGRLTEAARNYRRILDDPPSQETAPFRRAAAEVLPALEARIPRVRLRPSGLSQTDVLRVDGQVVSARTLGEGQALDPGEHTMVVERAGVERARVLFALGERELRYISLPLPVVPPGPAVGSVAEAGAAWTPAGDSPLLLARAPAAPAQKHSLWSSPWTWTAVVVVVAGAAAATFVVLDRRGGRDQTFSGNVPPGWISVR